MPKLNELKTNVVSDETIDEESRTDRDKQKESERETEPFNTYLQSIKFMLNNGKYKTYQKYRFTVSLVECEQKKNADEKCFMKNNKIHAYFWLFCSSKLKTL